ncbi:hypothetical protein B296_00031388 [Ensete ventricosum]|uniref:Uncharacterized protein n=1 Tax=Ensete ventricosum TaxID=4639 RepID=A0A426Y416_ENSVE|nr:hypothetical protein B296_00031388 [Ensete ventricosum]
MRQVVSRRFIALPQEAKTTSLDPISFLRSSRPKQRDANEVGKAEELDEDLERSVNCGGVRKGTYASTVGEGTVHARVGVLLARVAKEMVLQEIDALKFGGGLEAVAIAEERASELEKELEKTKRERDEALQRLEIFDKELNEARGDLSKAQRQLKEARVRA